MAATQAIDRLFDMFKGPPTGRAAVSENGTTFTRGFASGTRVAVNAVTKAYCVWWSNNKTTGNACA